MVAAKFMTLTKETKVCCETNLPNISAANATVAQLLYDPDSGQNIVFAAPLLP